MRAESLRAIRAAMPPEGRILDIGCGTGEEAVALLSERPTLRIVALDPSRAMLARAIAKAAIAGAAERLTPIQMRARELGGLRAHFDGAYSSFALSYEPDLRLAARALARALRPGASAVVSVRNRWAAAEPWSIPTRFLDRYRHKVGDARIQIRHASLPSCRADFVSAGFLVESVRALPLLLPPPRYGRLVPRGVARALAQVDGTLAGAPVLRALGDHLLLTVRRRPESLPGARES